MRISSNYNNDGTWIGTIIMKGTKVHNPRAILSLLKLIYVISKLYAIYMTL